VQKEHRKILRDFSLMQQTKLLEALDPEAFEMEEIKVKWAKEVLKKN
jgi:hypothetical protein